MNNMIVLFLFATLPFLLNAQSDAYQQRKVRQLAGPSPFQKDISGPDAKRILYQDSLVTVLDDLPGASQAPVHILAVPNQRIPTMNEMDESEACIIGRMLWALKNEARKKGVAETGYRIAINTNEDAGQSAFHIHAHLLGGMKTGAMVEQSWRNVRRAQSADSTYHTPATRDPMLRRLMGYWQSAEAEAFGNPAVVTMLWEPSLQFQWVKLSYRMDIQTPSGKKEIFEGTANYRPIAPNTYKATWSDSSGDLHPVLATADDNTLTALWGEAPGKQGKTTYRLTDNDTVEVTDYVLKDKEWKQFNRNVLKRVW